VSSPTSDPRVGQRLTGWQGERADVVLLGLPFDTGVVLGNGRPGAAGGPAALRRALLRFGTTYDFDREIDFNRVELRDAGDLQVEPNDVAETHDRLTEALAAILPHCGAAIVIGGGNDATFASVRALGQAFGVVGGINVDAHLDVREVSAGKITSGTPYRRILTELEMPGSNLVELALHGSVNARAHHTWVRERGVRCYGLGRLRNQGVASVMQRELQALSEASKAVFVSIDIDVFASAYAPGVSAPGTEGLRPEEGRELAFLAGSYPSVRLFELMELNPSFDVDDRTARLAAMLLCSFLAGVSQRTPTPDTAEDHVGHQRNR
jgi:formimidoylglutamase